MEKEKNFDFDPDFSEYNPIMEEIANIKRTITKKEDEGFMASLLKRFTKTAAFIPLEE